jgi:hypothetical protein
MKSKITIRAGIKMISALRRAKQHPWPSYGWKAGLAANLSLQSPRFDGWAPSKRGIRGQFMVVEVANL